MFTNWQFYWDATLKGCTFLVKMSVNASILYNHDDVNSETCKWFSLVQLYSCLLENDNKSVDGITSHVMKPRCFPVFVCHALTIASLPTKLLKKSSETQVWLTIYLLLPTHLYLHFVSLESPVIPLYNDVPFVMITQFGDVQHTEYGGGCKVKCAKMHCYWWTFFEEFINDAGSIAELYCSSVIGRPASL